MTAPEGPDARRTAARTESTPGRPSSGGPAPGRREPAPPGRPGPGGAVANGAPTTVLPGPAAQRPPTRPAVPRPADPAGSRPASRARKARLALKRVDPWSVFVFSLLASVFLGIAVVVAVAALYAVLDGLGVLTSVNELFGEVAGEGSGPLITAGWVVGGAAVVSAANVVLLTLLATLGALLYNLCASFTGGIELTLGARDG